MPSQDLSIESGADSIPQPCGSCVTHVGLHATRAQDESIESLIPSIDPDTVRVYHIFGCSMHGTWHGKVGACHLEREKISVRKNTHHESHCAHPKAPVPEPIIAYTGLPVDLCNSLISARLASLTGGVGLCNASVSNDEVEVIDAVLLLELVDNVEGALLGARVVFDHDQATT
ncbi:hypothetical protein BBP40_000539 [Aspergillus hancockii]|nr:hypothetical protein BBP40_000539 [Aspergillus hancockii]